MNPLTQNQLEALRKAMRRLKGDKIGRFLCAGKAVNIVTGEEVGGNVIYHPVYWDLQNIFFDTVKRMLEENNPGKVVKIVYSE